jgi:hypothetical protein
MAVKLECRGKVGGTQECAACGKKIHDRYLLKVKQLVNSCTQVLCYVETLKIFLCNSSNKTCEQVSAARKTAVSARVKTI